ncbi:MFS transporter [Solimonas fluminis]|uniref:MFS transporter n=1 Tax=Solimonas fluminis TaxID=2086571 RepID=A0A2S5TAJ9_9GAMM|nr:MFS transporter [Solimonas fluminis]PPE72024.1 MFS transporter [Solimonas fluminis]
MDRHELRKNGRALLAATLGMSAGIGLIGYINSVVAPYLLADFGWSRSQFALASTVTLLTILCIPLAGRCTDLFGVRRVAAVGIVVFPASFLVLSAMQGDIRLYFAMLAVQALLCTTTSATVYSRLIAENFQVHRGLALGLIAAGPAVVGAIGSPLLTALIDALGWRSGYLAISAFCALLGLAALLLIPPRRPAVAAQGRETRRAGKDYGAIVRSRPFWIIAASSLLCSLPHALSASQLKLMLSDRALSSTQAGFMVSVFAAGVIVARIVSGLALDRWPAWLVAAVGMGLPLFGLLILASSTADLVLIGFAVLLLGMSFGVEGDILTYLAARYFPLEIYSTVLGLLLGSVGAAMAFGAALLSITLAQTETYRLFMLISAAGVAVGSLNFLRLRTLG